MSQLRITQYIHCPNSTELGQGTTHETYLLISQKVNLSEMFPPNIDVKVFDYSKKKTYTLKSTKSREFRVNQMGDIYRDYGVMSGDEIIFTMISSSEGQMVYLQVKCNNRVVFDVGNKGCEISNEERLIDFKSENAYVLSIRYANGIQEARIEFVGKQKKRNDSPIETAFYDLKIDGNSLPNGRYVLDLEKENILHPFVKWNFDTTEIDSSLLGEDNSQSLPSEEDKDSKNLQIIYFGTPGSGKSYKVQERLKKVPEDNVFRTTFHPDSDYASFVGCYKPMMEGEEIKYEFTPQVFTNAYVQAWKKQAEAIEQEKKQAEDVYLVIEEINRGNCAQIFGDLFQLLDRDKDGVSEYDISPDVDLLAYLKSELPKDSQGLAENKLRLPANLHILATMNTSDQSLFPMDSAFKRRWDWEYVPIDYRENVDSSKFEISIGDKTDKKTYRWVDFLKAVNARILSATDSEDKQMGNFFIKHSVEEKEFKSKVMFYLWHEVCKDEYHTKNNFFRILENQEEIEFSFNQLHEVDGTKTLVGFMQYLGVTPLEEMPPQEGDGTPNDAE